MPKGIDGRLLRRRAPPLLACLLVALAVVVLATGCGNSGKSNSGSSTSTTASSQSTSSEEETAGAHGIRRVVPIRPVKQDRFAYARARFTEMCAGCHTLADAGARGRRFNLDHGGGIDETHVRATIANGEPGMPAWGDVLSPREFEELVTYLVAVSRRTPGDDYWEDQIHLRGDAGAWSRADTARLEAYAIRLVRERMRSP